MQSLKTITHNSNNSYNSNINNINNSYNSNTSKSRFFGKAEILSSFHDLIPDDGYEPFYYKELNRIGAERFIELANKARAGSDTPAKLFCWMLKNDKAVR